MCQTQLFALLHLIFSGLNHISKVKVLMFRRIAISTKYKHRVKEGG